MIARGCAVFTLLALLTSCAHEPASRPAPRQLATGDACVEAPVIAPLVPPPEPEGKDCLTHAAVQGVMKQLTHGRTTPDALRLVSAECHKRVYTWNGTRYIFWDDDDSVHGKSSTRTCAPPTEACIERALKLARDYAPFADTILRKAAERDPLRWRDPHIGAVSFLTCNSSDEPSFNSIETMLHEVNHRLSPGKCTFDWSTGGDFCFDLPRTLPEARIAAYDKPPAALGPDDVEWFRHVEKTYLFDNENDLRNMLDELVSYSVTSELLAVGASRRIYPRPGRSTYNNLPLMLALTARYLNLLASRDPVTAANQFGPKGRNRAAVDAVLRQAEGAYGNWLRSGVNVSPFERTFWDEYVRARDGWEERVR